MKVVADTMIWVSYTTLKDGRRHQVLRKAQRQRVRFFVSEYILEELAATLLEDLEKTKRYVKLALKDVLQIAKKIDLPSATERFVPGDPNDDPILQTALSAKADYLVTADKEILKVGKIEGIKILTLDEFDDLLNPD